MSRFSGLGRRLGQALFALVFLVGLAVCLLIAAEVFLKGASKAYGKLFAEKSVAAPLPRPIDMELYKGKDWAATYWREEGEAARMVWAPYVLWRRLPFAGEMVNVGSDRNRVTWRPEAVPAGAKTVRIWMFGGSTMWGSGARDWETIPSHLARRLADDGVYADVTNCGESGFVSTQGLILFLRRLVTEPKPDVVIFYDGYNDMFCSYQQRAPGLTSNEHNRRFEFNIRMRRDAVAGLFAQRYFPRLTALYSRLARGWAVLRGGRTEAGEGEYSPLNHLEHPMSDGERDALADGTLAVYGDNVADAAAVCTTRGIAFFAYWQPWIAGKNRLTDEERLVFDDTERSYPGALKFYALTEAKLAKSGIAKQPYFRDLSDAFKDDPRGYFYDQVHITGEGNAVVAGLMARDVLPLVHDVR